MPVTEGLQKLADPAGVPIDPNVRVPDHVRRASADADNLHKQAYAPPTPTPEEAATAAAATAEAERARLAEAAAQNPPQDQRLPDNQPQDQQHPALDPKDANVTAEEWRHRFLSMQGRYSQATKTIGSMEQQMTELAQELQRTQHMVQASPALHAPQVPQLGHDHNNLITDEDRANYGTELIDLAQRAAKSALTPEMDALRAENERLTNRVKITGRRELFATLDARMPVWRKVNDDARFKAWLRLPNVYTGQIRGNMLKAAVDGAEAPKVLQLFQDFLTEAQATGQMGPAPQQDQQQASQQLAPRQAAVSLDTLAAPGRARPASGDSQVPSEKPIYSRADISKFYDDKRRGHYAGRDAEVTAFEADLTAAQREGRIR